MPSTPQCESLLYARIAAPADADIVDDSFARTVGALRPSWTRGLPSADVRTLVLKLIAQTGVVVGWQLDSDFVALGFTEAAAAMTTGERTRVPFGSIGSAISSSNGADHDTVTARVIDLSDHYRCTNGSRCARQIAARFAIA